MNTQLKNLFTKVIRLSGLPVLVRALVQRNKVTILCLHDMPLKRARKTFQYLVRHYNIIDLNDFLEAQQKGDASRLPKNALIITFDDGHVRNHEMLLPLRQLKIPITIFLCAGIVDTKRQFWFQYKHPDIQTQELKKCSNRERLKKLEAAGFLQEQEYLFQQALDRHQIEALKPYVNFQGHTVFHPCLPKCADTEAWQELSQGKEILEQDFGLKVNAIAYPNGDYSERDIKLVKAAGYALGLTVDFGYNTIKTNPFRLKRLSVDDKDNVDAVALKASGIWGFVKTRNGKKQGHGWTEQVEQTPSSIEQIELKTK